MGGYIRLRVLHLHPATAVSTRRRRLRRLAASAGTAGSIHVRPGVAQLSPSATALAAKRWLSRLAALSGIVTRTSMCLEDIQAMSSEVSTFYEVPKMEHTLCLRTFGVMSGARLFPRHDCRLQFPWGLEMAATTGIHKKAK